MESDHRTSSKIFSIRIHVSTYKTSKIPMLPRGAKIGMIFPTQVSSTIVRKKKMKFLCPNHGKYIHMIVDQKKYKQI